MTKKKTFIELFSVAEEKASLVSTSVNIEVEEEYCFGFVWLEFPYRKEHSNLIKAVKDGNKTLIPINKYKKFSDNLRFSIEVAKILKAHRISVKVKVKKD